MAERNTYRCRKCGGYSHERMLLRAPNPFDPKDVLLGCPNCKSITDGFDEICDTPDCYANASCGFADKHGGHRRTCYEHSCFVKEKKNVAST